jgi:transposase
MDCSKGVSREKGEPVRPGGRNVVGIDIGKGTHAAAGVKATGEDWGPVISFDNDRGGVDRLEELVLKPLGGQKKLLLAMEATGHYWMPLYFELARRGYEAVVLNPIQTRGKFRTRIRKTKTDKLDARSIAHFVLSGDALAARIPDEKTFELRLLVRHRWRLMDMKGDLERFSGSLADRLFPEYAGILARPFLPTGRALIREIGLAPADVFEHSDEVAEVIRRAGRGRVSPEKVRTLIERARDSIGIGRAESVMVEQLRSTIDLVETIELEMKPLDEELARRVGEIGSPLPSLGLRAPIVATIHAESDPIADFRHPWQYAAFTGLDPSGFQTGQLTGTRARISKRGSPYLRRAYYLAAMSLYRRHADLNRSYWRARKKRHTHRDALVIVAHKLARIAWRMLTDNRPFTKRPPRAKKRA